MIESSYTHSISYHAVAWTVNLDPFCRSAQTFRCGGHKVTAYKEINVRIISTADPSPCELEIESLDELRAFLMVLIGELMYCLKYGCTKCVQPRVDPASETKLIQVTKKYRHSDPPSYHPSLVQI